MLSGTEQTHTHTSRTDHYKESWTVIKKQHRFPLPLSSYGQRFQEEMYLNTHGGKRRLCRFRGKYNRRILALNSEQFKICSVMLSVWPCLQFGREPPINFTFSFMSHYGNGLWDGVLKTYGRVTSIQSVWVLSVAWEHDFNARMCIFFLMH